MTKRKKPEIQNGLPTLESEVAQQDFEASLESGKKKGRPKGAANVDVDLADAQLTRCAKCGSTERSAYFNRRDVHVAGVHPESGPYTQIVIRRTRCLGCGQHRDDRHFVNKPARQRA
jgi:ferredoxin